MKLPYRVVAGTSIALVIAASAHAGALNKQRVAAGAEWLAHINVEAVVASKLFKAAHEHAGEMHVDLNGLNEMKTELGIDPLTDLKDLTAYGAGDPDDGNMVIVASTTGNVDQAVAKLKAQMPIVEVTVAGQTIFKIDDDGDETFFQVRPGKSTDDRIVILAQSQENISNAIQVLDGKAANLASAADSPLAKAATPGSGSMFFAAAKGLPWVMGDDDDDDDDDNESDPASQILRTSDRLSLDMGEEDADTYVSVLLGTGSADDARNITDILTGFMAMGRLAISHHPELADAKSLINSVKTSTTGNDVRIDIRHNTDALIKVGKTFAEMHHHDDHDDHGEHHKHDHKDDGHHHDHTAKPDAGADNTHPAPG